MNPRIVCAANRFENGPMLVGARIELTDKMAREFIAFIEQAKAERL